MTPAASPAAPPAPAPRPPPRPRLGAASDFGCAADLPRCLAVCRLGGAARLPSIRRAAVPAASPPGARSRRAARPRAPAYAFRHRLIGVRCVRVRGPAHAGLSRATRAVRELHRPPGKHLRHRGGVRPRAEVSQSGVVGRGGRRCPPTPTPRWQPVARRTADCATPGM